MNKNQRIKIHFNKDGSFKIPKAQKESSWGASRNSKLKRKIKFHYSVFQQDKCAYCREEIRYGGYGEPIEHIFPKSKAPNWTFEPLNLCLSCYGCNTKKKDKLTMTSKYVNGMAYPRRSEDFKIIHPHFDCFSKFIDTSRVFYKPHNGEDKGRETIDICQLNRMDLLFKRAKRSKKGKKVLLEFHFNSLSSSYASKEDRQLAKNFINNLIKRAKYKEKLQRHT